jgi:DNA-binding transcriptional ArsR family regulator
MTPANEERLKILQMLEEGKISADEASTLLRALEGGGQQRSFSPALVGTDGRFFHVHVTNLETGAEKVNVTIPMGLVKVGLRMAERFAPEFEDIDMTELEELITSGVTGKLVEVTDTGDGERVEIYVE